MYGDILLGKNLNEDQISFLFDYIQSSCAFLKKTIEDDYYLSIPIHIDEGIITDEQHQEYCFVDVVGMEHYYMKYDGRFISDGELEGCIQVTVHSHEQSPCLYEIFPLRFSMEMQSYQEQVTIYLQSLKNEMQSEYLSV